MGVSNMNISILNQKIPTMSSREIAKLCEKEHRNVLADIRNVCEQLQIDVLSFQHIYLDSMNRQQIEYLLNKDMTLTLVSGYNVRMRHAIITRWQELENQQVKLPSNYIEALESLLESEKQKQALQIELTNAQPKINHYNKVVERSNLVNATQIGAKLGGMSAIVLNRHLDELGVYNKNVKRGRVFNAWFEQKGYGEMKQTELGFDQPLFTQKGQAWIIEKLTMEGVA